MQTLVSITKALSDENRLRAIWFLREGELCVCRLIDMLELAPSTVSRHLTLLQQAGLVESRKEGRWRYYRLPGRKAPGTVARALAWVLASMGEDPRAAECEKRRKLVMKKRIEDLCALYKS